MRRPGDMVIWLAGRLQPGTLADVSTKARRRGNVVVLTSEFRTNPGQEGAAGQARARILPWLHDLFRHTADAGHAGELSRGLSRIRTHYRYALLFSAVISALYLSSAIYMMLVYDKVLQSGSHLTLAVLTLALAGALGTLAWLDMVRARLMVRANMRLDRELSARVITAALRGVTRGDLRAQQVLRDLDQFRGRRSSSSSCSSSIGR
jgi:hypothetical protein